MPNLNLVSARLSTDAPTGAVCEYVVAGNGLFVLAHDARLKACIPVAWSYNRGLPLLEAYARLTLPRIPAAYLTAVWQSALRHMPNEAAYQFVSEAPLPWRVICPNQTATPTSVDFVNEPDAVVDLHSHGALGAFWSEVDDRDEQGLRFYCVIGNLDLHGVLIPHIFARVGVYGHHWPVPATAIFDGLGPFIDLFDKEQP